MFLTRIGKDSKMIVTGDLDQCDLLGPSGLVDLMQKIKRNEEKGINYTKIQSIQFTDEDVERHPVIKDILKLYK